MGKEKKKKVEIDIEIEVSEELETSESQFKRDLSKVILSDTQRSKDSETS